MKDAFLKLETLDDLHDAVLLALSGYNLTFEPVAGALGGKAMTSSIETYVRGQRGRAREFAIRVEDTPQSIAEAVHFIASVRDSSALIERHPQTRIFPLEAVGAWKPDRKERVLAFLKDMHQAFDMRTGRPCLSETDIIGVMEWLADFADVEIVAQVPYAAGLNSRWWGRMVRGETSSPEIAFHAAPSRVRVSIFAHAKPKEDHLTGFADWARGQGREIIVVNGPHADRLLPGTRGTSPDGRILLSNHCLIERVPFEDRPQSPEALYAALQAAGAAAHGKATQELPEGLQRVWSDQAFMVRPCAVEDRRGIDWETVENHVSAGIFKAGQAAKLPIPYRAAGCFPVERMGPDDLLTRWDDVIAAVLT